MKYKQVLITSFICLLASFGGAFIYSIIFNSSPEIIIENPVNEQPIAVSKTSGIELQSSFVVASKKCTPSVVFIKTESQVQRTSSWFFGFDPFGRVGKVASTGSGVIVSENGYIITNHHVIQNADKIEVVLSESQKTFNAELIGTAPSSDLALLKIKAEKLTPITFEDSDAIEIGEWVLAVGNPFNLTSTVTAGIVSAKGRNINIVNNQFPIESFIQTDAAINPGNSGGALVNTNGDLVGVNTAIASKTGSYIGYGFAIPSNIVAKIIQDLKAYGEVQRAFLGVEVTGIDGNIAEDIGIKQGVLINRVNSLNPSAVKMLQAGDVITKIEEKKILNKPSYDELMAYHRPGDLIKVEVYRENKLIEFDIKLVNKQGTTELIKKESIRSDVLGADFEKLSKIEQEAYGIKKGIKVSNITNGKLRKMNIPEDFVFTKVNQKDFDEIEDLISYLENIKGQVRIEGVSPSGARQFFSFYLY